MKLIINGGTHHTFRESTFRVVMSLGMGVEGRTSTVPASSLDRLTNSTQTHTVNLVLTNNLLCLSELGVNRDNEGLGLGRGAGAHI